MLLWMHCPVISEIVTRSKFTGAGCSCRSFVRLPLRRNRQESVYRQKEETRNHGLIVLSACGVQGLPLWEASRKHPRGSNRCTLVMRDW
jgi:hypothetical protein